MGGTNQSGVDPGQAQDAGDVQNDQPDVDTQTSDQGNEDIILQSFYQLPNEVRQVISALPEEQRTPAIQAFDQHRKDVEERMRQEIENGRPIRDNLNALLADPNIQRYITTGEFGNTDQAERQSAGTPNQQKYVEKYGREAADFMSDIKTSISEGLGLEGLVQTVQELGAMVRSDKQASAWDDLKTMAQENQLPDPDNYKSTIASLLRSNANLTVDQAYRAALDVKDLQVRPSVATQSNRGGGGDQQAAAAAAAAALSTASPGANKGGISTRYETEEIDPVDKALADRKAGKVKSLVSAIREGATKTLQKINERDGTSFTMDDL